jgi:hypothetical protein
MSASSIFFLAAHGRGLSRGYLCLGGGGLLGAGADLACGSSDGAQARARAQGGSCALDYPSSRPPTPSRPHRRREGA